MLYPDFNELVKLKEHKKVLTHSYRKTVKSLTAGNRSSPFRGQGLEFDSVRQYVPGDDIRNIDWRVTARVGSPHLKLFKEDRERQIFLAIDVNEGMRFGTKKTFKSVQAAKIAALLAWQGVSQQDRVTGYLFGDVAGGVKCFSPSRSRKSVGMILKALSEPPAESHDIALETVLETLVHKVHSGALVYVISDFLTLDEKARRFLLLLRKKCDVVFVSINDIADQILCPVGFVRFCSNKEQNILIDTESSKGRDVYKAQWMNNRKLLQEMTTALKIPLITLTTESEVEKDLRKELKLKVRRSK